MPASFGDLTCCSFHLLSICKHGLGLCDFIAQTSLLDELGRQPLQIIWLKAGVKFFATVHCFQRQSIAMGGYASNCGAVEGLSQGLVCTASLVSQSIGVPRSMGLLGVARANTAVGASPETFLLLLSCEEMGHVQPARLGHGGLSRVLLQ
jgi:hypothetical protein